jgi:mannose/fructose/N-acetylgalactosamine-specific phosphotransferase system component IIB
MNKPTKEEFHNQWTRIRNKIKKLEDSLEFSDFSTYTLVKTVVEMNKKIPDITVEKYIEAIKKPEHKEILIKLKKLEDEWHELREIGHIQEESLEEIDHSGSPLPVVRN